MKTDRKYTEEHVTRFAHYLNDEVFEVREIEGEVAIIHEPDTERETVVMIPVDLVDAFVNAACRTRDFIHGEMDREGGS